MALLPKNEATFSLEVEGDVTKKRYEGKFTVKCVLENWETMEVGLRADRYNAGSATLANQFKLFNRALAEAEVRVMFDKERNKPMAPSWWIDSDAGRSLLDQNVVFEVYAKCIEATKSWKDSLEGEISKSEAMKKKPAEKAAAPKAE
jgi:hypothetical protein